MVDNQQFSIPPIPPVIPDQQEKSFTRSLKDCFTTVWTLMGLQLVCGAVGGVLLGIVAGILMGIMAGADYVDFYDGFSIFSQVVVFAAAGGIAWYTGSKLTGIKIKNQLNFGKFKPGCLAAPMLTYAFYMPLAFLLNIIQFFLSSFGLEIPALGNVDAQTPFGMFFDVLFAVVIAPVIEEIIFRGIILGSLKKYSKVFALFFSSLIFAFVHMNLYQGLPVFGMALAFGLMYLVTDSLAVSIYMHAFNNLFATLINLFPQAVMPLTVLVLIFTVLGWVYFGFMHKKFKATLGSWKCADLWKQTFKRPSFWLLMMIFVGMSIGIIFRNN